MLSPEFASSVLAMRYCIATLPRAAIAAYGWKVICYSLPAVIATLQLAT